MSQQVIIRRSGIPGPGSDVLDPLVLQAQAAAAAAADSAEEAEEILSTALTSKGVITDTSNIDLVDPGFYVLGTNTNRPAGTFPSGYDSEEIGFLASMTSLTRTIQVLTTTSGTQFWFRFITIGGAAADWLPLVNSFYKGTLTTSGSNVDNLTAEGSYVITSAVSGTLPAGFQSYGILEVQGFGNFWLHRLTAIRPGLPPVEYVRTKTVAYGLTDWNNSESGLPLSGKTIVFMGDSITQGSGSPSEQYPAYVAALTGATVVNLAIGGTQMANHLTAPNYSPFSWCNFAEAIVSGDWLTQDTAAPLIGGQAPAKLALAKSINFDQVYMVVVAFGMNDMGNGVALGSPTSTDNDEFYGAMNNGTALMFQEFPTLRIGMICPYDRLENGSGGSMAGMIEPYVDAIIERCQRPFCSPYLDLYRTYNINQWTAAARLDNLFLHPKNAAEYSRLGDAVSGWLIGTI